MANKNFTSDVTQNMGIEAKCEAGYRTLSYSGNLGGGTLRISTVSDGVTSFVPDSKLSGTTVDLNGDAIKQVNFVSTGQVYVGLTGSSGANCDVAVN